MYKNLPIYYRLELSEKLATAFRVGKSINLVGMPAVGKNTYLNFLLFNKERLLLDGGKDLEFVVVNTREFEGEDMDSFKTFLYTKAKDELSIVINESTDLEDFLIQTGEYKKIYFILRFLEELDKKFLEKLFRYLLVIRQNPYNARFLFMTNRPLAEKIEDAVVRSRLLSMEEYFQPISEIQFELELAEYKNFLELNFNSKDKKDLYELTGGHGGYLKYAASHLKEKRLKFHDSDLIDVVRGKGELPGDLIKRSQELMRVFTEDEIKFLSSIAKNEEVKTIPELFYSLGIVKTIKGKPIIFSSILSAFLQSQ